MKKISLFIIIFLMFKIVQTSAQIIKISPSADAYVSNQTDRSTCNFGKIDRMSVMAWTSGKVGYTNEFYIRFNLSSLPACTEIVSAKLKLFYVANYGGLQQVSNITYTDIANYYRDNSTKVLKVLSNWNEGTITWKNKPPKSSTILATLPNSTSRTQDYEIDITSIAKDWKNFPTNNFGLGFELENLSEFCEMVFGTKENANVSKRPVLEITYRPSISVSFNTTNPCYATCNGSATANALGGTPPYTYKWANVPGITTAPCPPSSCPFIEGQSINGLCKGNYNVTVTDAIGCAGTGNATLTEPASSEVCENTFTLLATPDPNNSAYAIVNMTQQISDGCGFYWKVEEINLASGATIEGTVMDNPPNWWDYGIRLNHNFPGYYGNSNTTTGNGIFRCGHTYRFTHSVWSRCDAGSTNVAIMTIPYQINSPKIIKYENNHMVQSETANSVSNNESPSLIFSVFPNPTTGRIRVNVGNYNNEEYKIQVME
ncbi:MAG: DNRLRE domain-containing protein, partial [Bacteroidales bacterium]|nr:DNRLRE domain-containing protein [Bacteroidales bacterium]